MQSHFAKLPTEQNNTKTSQLDRHSILGALKLMNQQDAMVPGVVHRALPQVTKAVALVVAALKNKGRMFLFGAGTSGRLAVMEAAECPPTFGTPPSLVQAFMAGGRASVFRSKEGAEDGAMESKTIVQKKVLSRDVVIGVAASGVTPYVKSALSEARRKKTKTVFITCNPHVSSSIADVVIPLNTGAEVISGSTRLKAATATKLVLNAITVVSMVQLGKVYGNRMVDLQPRSLKLKARALRLVSELGQVSPKKAAKILTLAKGQTKTAILMAKTNMTFEEAQRKLKIAQGRLSDILSSDLI